jgi:hypothetical protein
MRPSRNDHMDRRPDSTPRKGLDSAKEGVSEQRGNRADRARVRRDWQWAVSAVVWSMVHVFSPPSEQHSGSA